MAVAHRPALDGALPLAAALTLTGAFAPELVVWLAALVFVFAAAMALTTGADRPGEPALAWRLYGLGAAALAVTIVVGGPAEPAPFVLILAGLAVHVHGKARHGTHRIGLLSALGRRAHDARVGRTIEAMCAVLTAAALTHVAALYVFAGWLLTSAAVAERSMTGPADPRRDAEPAPAA